MVDTWYHEFTLLVSYCVLSHCPEMELIFKRDLHEIQAAHSNCTDVCLSQKVRDVMGLHLEHFSVIKRPVGEMEAIKAESCSILQSFQFYVKKNGDLILHSQTNLNTYFRDIFKFK